MSSCTSCIADMYYLHAATKTCQFRGEPCNLDTHYESPLSPANGTRICLPLTPCDTRFQPISRSLAVNLPAIRVRFSYIREFQTKISDRKCWNFTACPLGHYMLQALEDDDAGFLRKELICRPYKPCIPNEEYMLLDGSLYGDRDYICSRYTAPCALGFEYEVRSITATRDRLCKPYTRCNEDTEYVLQMGGRYRVSLSDACGRTFVSM